MRAVGAVGRLIASTTQSRRSRADRRDALQSTTVRVQRTSADSDGHLTRIGKVRRVGSSKSAVVDVDGLSASEIEQKIKVVLDRFKIAYPRS